MALLGINFAQSIVVVAIRPRPFNGVGVAAFGCIRINTTTVFAHCVFPSSLYDGLFRIVYTAITDVGVRISTQSLRDKPSLWWTGLIYDSFF